MATKPEVTFDLAGRRVWVAGHGGMVGQALVRRLAGEGCEILTVPRREADLRDQAATEAWIADNKPDAVFVAAATVGGILANDSRPAEFLYDNLMIEANIVHAAWRHGIAKLLFLGSSCIYPREAAQPMREEALLTGPLEPTNEWYAVAKIAGIKLCQAYRRQYGADFISAMPTNLYGPGDNFDLRSSHVVPALIRKCHEAKAAGGDSVEIWGTGTPRREFLYVDDLADALVHLMRVYSGDDHVNVGGGQEVSIAELAETVAGVVGFRGRFDYDSSKPDGTPRKLLDASRLAALGWRAETSLGDGLAVTYDWFRQERAPAAG
ncbi:MAG: GDP-L-fucose synthase [Alphaproteobacteria bacterium]|nr:GDP-L-fucose synthase [Alphaproteobacteria bacterium]